MAASNPIGETIDPTTFHGVRALNDAQKPQNRSVTPRIIVILCQ